MANDFVNTITTKDGTTYDIKGGTKLYKHSGTLQFDDGSSHIQTCSYVLYTTVSTQLTTSNFASSLGYGDKIISIHGTVSGWYEGYAPILSCYNHGRIHFVIFALDEGVIDLTLETYTSVSDTVTEL